MGSVCISTAAILRCPSLTEIQNIALIIPAALEVIFSTSLVLFNRGSGRRHLLLTAEGWIYFILALLELLSDILPVIRGNLPLFRGFDLGIGVASFLPLFFYTFFLYLFANAELVETLPNYVRNVSKIAMILFVPAIVVSNEVASLVGINLVSKPHRNSSPTLDFVFSSNRDEWLWLFFSSLTLAILSAFQAIVFAFSFFRLVHTLVHQRQVAAKGVTNTRMLKGVGWISAAMKLGAVESIVGFATGGFEVSLARRIVRLVARSCLYIGVVKGVDAVEDSGAIRSSFFKDKPSKGSRRSQLQKLISNPRFSTFRELSPTATSFHATNRATGAPFASAQDMAQFSSMRPPHYLTYSQRQRLSQLQEAGGMAQFASVKEQNVKQRVTVLYDLRDGAPSLQVRFSTLDLPNPAFIADKFKSRPRNEWLEEANKPKMQRIMESARSSFTANNSFDSNEPLTMPKPKFFKDSNRASSQYSRESIISPMPSPFEIVSMPRQEFSQRKAEARMLEARTPTPSNTLDSRTRVDSNNSDAPSSVSMSFAPPARPPSPPRLQTQIPRRGSDQTQTPSDLLSPETTVSLGPGMSIVSLPESLKAVRELASQFPGPPALSVTRPSGQFRPGSTLWEEDTVNSSVPATPNMFIGQAVGSPSELTFGGASMPGSSGNDETTSWANSRASSVLAPATPPGSSQGHLQISPSKGKGVARLTYVEKPIDPFDDQASLSSMERAATPLDPVAHSVVAPPREDSLMINTNAEETAQHLSNMWADSPLEMTPTSGLSGYTPFTTGIPFTAPRSTTTTGDQVLDLGTALDTGKSQMFRPRTPSSADILGSRPKSDQQSLGRPRSRSFGQVSASATTPKLAKGIEQPVDVSTSPFPQGGADDNNLQDLHKRGTSIDNLSIRWGVKGAPKPPLMRLKSVGTVASKSTPTPTYDRVTRTSFSVQPITIPPRSTNLPQAVQVQQAPQMQYGSVNSSASFSGRGVLRDSEVLGIEDEMYVSQSRRMSVVAGKQANYF